MGFCSSVVALTALRVRALRVSGPKIIVGAGGTQQEGWISLERDHLDIRSYEQWGALFEPGSVAAVVSEHVLEHLTPDEAREVVRNVYEFLACGGYWRIAVPDANNPDPKYQEYCRPGGPGQERMARLCYARRNEPDHKDHYELASLSRLLETAGFFVRPLEYYTREGNFRQNHWQRGDGKIKRSSGSSYLWLNYLWADCWNTSLIVDGLKQC